jgi:predicted amidohydrolase
MNKGSLTVALISDVFFDNDPAKRLAARLAQARDCGAQLAVLPELPLNPWSPATKTPRDDDAEDENGARFQMQSQAARDVGIALVGGAIIRDPHTGTRRNTALVLADDGSLLGTFAKCHLPEEPGFWETSHYEPGTHLSPVFDQLGVPFGVQICSDINRPQGCQILGGLGAHLVVAPRATELATYQRWRIVFQANALTSCLHMLSVNRPAPEHGVLIGGSSFAVDPLGQILAETTDPGAEVQVLSETVGKAKLAYPGYLPVRADLYARAWDDIARDRSAKQVAAVR